MHKNMKDALKILSSIKTLYWAKALRGKWNGNELKKKRIYIDSYLILVCVLKWNMMGTKLQWYIDPNGFM